MKHLKGWRTVVTNALIAIVTIGAWPQVSAFIDPQLIVLIVSLANFLLRLITSTSVGGKP